MDEHAQGDPFRQDVRIALSMAGGVSLAVWMGGVSAELYRLTRAGRSGAAEVYDGILDLTRSSASVDVVAGTSAGGINGAVLAFGIANDIPSIDSLRRVWIETGTFDTLLRPISAAAPRSLLQGDDVLYKELHRALGELWASRTSHGHVDADVTLMMTTTLLDGRQIRFPDSFGTDIFEVDHRGVLTFTTVDADAGEPLSLDPPTPSGDDDPPGLYRLALAARSSASFPVAFEASYLPVDSKTPLATDSPVRYDMGRAVDFADAGSRYAIDGGVLANRPLGPVLDAVSRRPADRYVRRVLALVVPDPSRAAARPPAKPDAPPTLAEVGIASALTIPRNQSLRSELEEIEDHNRRVGDVGSKRRGLVGIDLEETALRVLPLYRERRSARSVESTLHHLFTVHGSATRSPVDLDEVRTQLRKERIRLIPDTLEFGDEDRPWPWGIATLRRMGAAVVSLTNDAYSLIAPGDTHLAADLAAVKAATHKTLADISRVRVTDGAYWADQWRALLASTDQPDTDALNAWARRAYDGWPYGQDARAEREQQRTLERELSYGRRIAAEAIHLREVVSRFTPAPDGDTSLEELQRVLEVFAPGPPAEASHGSEVDRTLARLLAAEVLELGEEEAAADQRIELIQISARTSDAFRYTVRVPDADMKLASVRLGHFAGFYRKAWRANDWMWGRLDGAARIVQILLDPRRLRQVYRADAPAAAAAIHNAAVGGRHADWLGARYDGAAIDRELAFLTVRGAPLPARLPQTEQTLLRRIQLEILDEELRNVEIAARQDEADGGKVTPVAASFRIAMQAFARGDGRSDADKLIAAFAACDFGRETILDDAGSDYLTKLSAQTVGVALAALQGAGSGLGLLRAPLRVLRGAFLMLYWLARGAIGTGPPPGDIEPDGVPELPSGDVSTGGDVAGLRARIGAWRAGTRRSPRTRRTSSTHTAAVILLFAMAGLFIAAGVSSVRVPGWVGFAGLVSLVLAIMWVYARGWRAVTELGGKRAGRAIAVRIFVVGVLAVLPFVVGRLADAEPTPSSQALNDLAVRTRAVEGLDGVAPDDIEIVPANEGGGLAGAVDRNAGLISATVLLGGLVWLGAWTVAPQRPIRRRRKPASDGVAERSIGWVVVHDERGDHLADVRLSRGRFRLILDGRDPALDQALQGLTAEDVVALRNAERITFDRRLIEAKSLGARVAAADPDEIEPDHRGRWRWRMDPASVRIVLRCLEHGWLYPDDQLVEALRSSPDTATAVDALPIADLRKTVHFGRLPSADERLAADTPALLAALAAVQDGWDNVTWRSRASSAAGLIHAVDPVAAQRLRDMAAGGDEGYLIAEEVIIDWMDELAGVS